MKNVSFGELIVKREIPRLTTHQAKVDNIVSDYLESRRSEDNYLGTVADKVSDEMFSDILMIHKNDGSTVVKLVENDDNKKEHDVEWFQLDKKDKKPVKLSAKESYDNIQKKVATYADKLRNLAPVYYQKLMDDPRFADLTVRYKQNMDNLSRIDENDVIV